MISKNLRTDTYEQIVKGKESTKPLSCCICLMDFKEESRTTALKCDHRHIFHEKCLQQALEVKLACPICREPVLFN